MCSARLSPHRWLRRAGGAYVFFFRGVPMLVQLLLVYYLLPFAGINVPPLVAAISAVSLCSASYMRKSCAAASSSIPPGQVEAARMLGLAPFDTLRRILVPQAFKLTLPSLVNEMVLLIKASSLISVVGMAEITRTAQNIAASTYRPLEAYVAGGPHLLRDLRRALARRACRRSPPAARLRRDAMQQFDPSVITHNLPAIRAGLATTLGTWIAGVVLGLAIGFVIALLQLFAGRWVRGVSARLHRTLSRHAISRAALPALLRRPVVRPHARTD